MNDAAAFDRYDEYDEYTGYEGQDRYDEYGYGKDRRLGLVDRLAGLRHHRTSNAIDAFDTPFPAHRPTRSPDQLNDPVLSVRTLGRYEYAARRLPAGADHALVLTTTGHTYREFLPPVRPSRAEIASGRFTAMYEVDLGVHRFRTELKLPSEHEAFSFAAEADFEWQVRDPIAFVVSGERHVPQLLSRLLLRAVRQATATHPVGRARNAELAARAALGLSGPLGADRGIAVDCELRLAVDDQTHAHAADLRRQHDAHALVQLRQDHERALRAYLDEKIDYYQQYLRQGGVAAWAFHLAQHPEDGKLAMETLTREQLELIRSQYAVARELITGGEVEAYELEGPKKLLLQFIQDSFERSLPDGPSPLPALEPDAGHDRRPAPRPPADEQSPPGPFPSEQSTSEPSSSGRPASQGGRR